MFVSWGKTPLFFWALYLIIYLFIHPSSYNLSSPFPPLPSPTHLFGEDGGGMWEEGHELESKRMEDG